MQLELAFPDTGLIYPDRIAVTRPGEAVQDPVTGIPTPGPDTVVLEDRADVQDARIRVQTRPDGSEVLEAGARVYVPLTANLSAVESGDRVTVQQAGTGHGPAMTRPGEVVTIDLFDQLLLVRWV